MSLENMRLNQQKIIILSFLLVLALPALVFLVAAGESSNCGGNCAALVVVSDYVSKMQNEDGTMKDYGSLMPQDKANIDAILRNLWLHGMRFAIHKSPGESSGPVPIIMCEKMYSNIPRPTILNLYHQSPRHAIAYSDGLRKLIADDEYHKLLTDDYILVGPFEKR